MVVVGSGSAAGEVVAQVEGGLDTEAGAMAAPDSAAEAEAREAEDSVEAAALAVYAAA